MKNTQKKSYEVPQLKKVGSFEAVTQGASSGARLDANFNINTPATALTFS